MTLQRFPMAIHQRLGNAGAAALSEVFEAYKDDVVTPVTHQFEQRLNRECGARRGEMAEMQGALRGAIGELRGELRGEITAFRSEVRTEMKELRMEMRSDFKIELASARTDLLKWSFVFWVGQLVGVVGVITAIR